MKILSLNKSSLLYWYGLCVKYHSLSPYARKTNEDYQNNVIQRPAGRWDSGVCSYSILH